LIIYAIAIAAVAAGFAIGAGAMVITRRSGQTRDQSIQRQRTVLYCALVVVAAVLIYDAIDTEKHRYLNLALLAIMVGGVAFDWVRARRRRTLS
jgi:phosphatidylserine synthase